MKNNVQSVAMTLLLGFGLLLTVGCSAQSVPDLDSEWVVLPAGDPAGGRRAFGELRCADCHRIPGDPEYGEGSLELGPDLDEAMRRRPPGDLVSSILAPSHVISGDRERFSDVFGDSLMPDYSEAMTVAELVDIVSFLKSLDQEMASGGGQKRILAGSRP